MNAFRYDIRGRPCRDRRPLAALKRFAAAALLGAFAPAAAAQAAGVPVHKCEPKPVYPGVKALGSEAEVKAFEGQIKSYKECILAYISERRATSRAHEAAANAAADEHNALMEKIRSDQQSAQAEAEKARAPQKK